MKRIIGIYLASYSYASFKISQGVYVRFYVTSIEIENYIVNITNLDLSRDSEAEISSLEGVNTYCKNLKSLTLNSSGNITSLDLSGLTNLSIINFNGAEDKITYLDISNTNITNLDLSRFPNLKTLRIS